MKKLLTMSLALLLLALGWTVPTKATNVYFQPNSNWQLDGARFALYMFTGSEASAWTDFAVVDAGNNIYKATFDDSYSSMIICRMDPNNLNNNWDNKWNQTNDLNGPAADKLLYILAEGQWDGASVGNGLTIIEDYAEPVASGVVAFLVETADRTKDFITDYFRVGGVNNLNTNLSDGTHVLLNFDSAGSPNGNFFKVTIDGDWTNAAAVEAMNSELGTAFVSSDFAVNSTLHGTGPGPGDAYANLNLTFDSDVNVGDLVTLYVTVLGQNGPLDNVTVTGLDEMAIAYAVGSGDGFVSTATFSPDMKGLTLVKITGKLTDGKLVKVTSTSMSGTNSAKNGFQIAAYKVTAGVEEPSEGYLCDFNTPITTSDHEFQVASNWRHIVDSYTSYYGGVSYPSYTYSESAGVDESGALSCGTNQSSNSIYDLLVTPVVKGTVTIDAKRSVTYYSPLLEFYKITDNGDGTFTRGDKIDVDVSAVNVDDFTTITIPVDAAGERIGIRSSYVWLDNFTATEATIIPEKKMSFVSAVAADGNSGTTGTIKWEQQANGNVLVSYTVTVTNTGDVDLVQNEEGFSVSIINGSTGVVYGTTAVPQNLAQGETSDEFVVSAEVSPELWPNSYTYVNMNLKENLFGSVMERAQSTYTAYEPIFVFRAAESTATSSITAAEAWGTITESTTKSYEIANTGTAPLTIKSVTLPEGFTSDNAPTAEFTLAKGETQALNITQDATVTGTYAGSLAIVYLDKDDVEQTYSLAFSVTVIGANTWTADFNGDGTKSTITYPDGSIAENGISSDYTYSNSKYDVYPVGRSQTSYATENNKFITPKLHANAGDALAYDVKVGYSSTNQWYVKVYVSTDRQNWGDPVAYYTTTATTESEAVGSAFTTKTINFDTEGDYYVAFALYGQTSAIDNLVGLEKADVAHDLYIKSVSWPDATIKSGNAQTKPTVSFYPLTTENPDNYTVKYICGETVLAEATSKALTPSASSTTDISFSWTPVVEETTTYENTKVVFEFTDGTKFETEEFDLTVANEAVFHFLNTAPSSKWYEPTDRSEPITFGKTNTADTQNFVIFNWGSADLTVNSISLPDGFSTTTEFPLTVVAFNGENDGIAASCQALDITFSATQPGDYSGDMVITYSGDQTFTLPISGTKLDPNKFYATFGTSSDASNYPAGSLVQSNVSITTPTTDNGALVSSSSTKNLFITPKLTTTGETVEFDARVRSTYYSGSVQVYSVTDNKAAANTASNEEFEALNPTLLGEFTIGTDVSSFTTYSVAAPAGEYYLAFKIADVYVDEIYGLTVADVAHDWTVVSSNIPEEAMQNVASTASVNILNLGLQDEAADAYTATIYVDGEAVATAEGVAIPMNHKLSDAGTKISFSYIYPKVGTFPVYIEVKDGDYSVATDPVDVNFTGEVATAEGIQVGTQTSTGRDYGFVDWYNNDGSGTKYTDILYPASKISAAGIKAGDKITAISFKGSNSAKTFKAEVTSWVGTSTGDITYGSPNKEDMAEVVVYTGTVEFPANIESVITLPEPIVWDGESDIRVYTEAVGQGSGNWMSVQYAYDNELTMSYNGTTKYGPVAFFTLAAEPATLSGTVKTSGNAGIEGASITLKAENGVEYSGTTDSEGAFSINVIQAGLDFTATVEADGFLTREFEYSLGGESQTLDVTLYQYYGIVGDSGMGLDWNEDQVMIQSDEDPMVFTLELNDVEIAAGSYEYKLRTDGIWGAYELPANGNYTFNCPATGTYTLKFTADVANHSLTLDALFKYTLAEDAFENGGNPFEITTTINELTVERTFNQGWNAVVLPFVLTQEEITSTFGEGSVVAFFNGDIEDASGNVSVSFDKYDDDLAANKPYLIYVAEAVTNPTFENKTLVDPNWAELKGDVEGTCYDFMGTYTKIGVNAGDMFISGGQFKTATTNNKVRAFRTYLKSKSSQGARSVSIFIDGNEISVATPTGIENASDDTTIDGNVYNVNGQRVNKDVKRGVYIINGKKVAVK